MTTLNENPHAGGYLVREDGGAEYCRDQVVLTGGPFVAGTVLGKITLGAQTVHAAVAFAGNVTNDTVSAPTSSAGAPAGDYKVVGNTTGATGEFQVFKPDGMLDGEGKVGTAYTGTIGFTITAGGTALAVDDGWTITVSYAAGSGDVTECNPAATDGSQVACAILYDGADGSVAAVDVTISSRATAFNAAEVTWKSGMTDPQIAAATAQLAAVGLIAR